METIEEMTFASTYKWIAKEMQQHPVSFACRGLEMGYEMEHVRCPIVMPHQGISIFSHPAHRVIPIKFVLAEYCHILSGRDDVDTIASYAKVMGNYSDDGISLNSAYGKRLHGQFEKMLTKVFYDPYTRQACMSLYGPSDAMDTTFKNVPCNTFMQLMYRHECASLAVISRSSDFVTGFSIDTLHWQLMLMMMVNQMRGWGWRVTSGELYYTLTSLHVYLKDKGIIDQWKSDVGCYEYYVATKKPLIHAIGDCQKSFRKGMNMEALCDLIGLDQESRNTCNMLDHIFKEHRNLVRR